MHGAHPAIDCTCWGQCIEAGVGRLQALGLYIPDEIAHWHDESGADLMAQQAPACIALPTPRLAPELPHARNASGGSASLPDEAASAQQREQPPAAAGKPDARQQSRAETAAAALPRVQRVHALSIVVAGPAPGEAQHKRSAPTGAEPRLQEQPQQQQQHERQHSAAPGLLARRECAAAEELAGSASCGGRGCVPVAGACATRDGSGVEQAAQRTSPRLHQSAGKRKLAHSGSMPGHSSPSHPLLLQHRRSQPGVVAELDLHSSSSLVCLHACFTPSVCLAFMQGESHCMQCM
jgi:hypothetical protein